MSLHPQLLHYVTRDEADATCTSTGTTGEWNAASGKLRRLAGVVRRSVGLGRRYGRGLDQLRERLGDAGPRRLRGRRHPAGRDEHLVRGRPGRMGRSPGAPQGSSPNANDWIDTDASGFPVGASITTPDSILMGLRDRGYLDSRGAQRRDGPGDGITCSAVTTLRPRGSRVLALTRRRGRRRSPRGESRSRRSAIPRAARPCAHRRSVR